MTDLSEPTRTRDPDRKERILAAAADLVAQRGYHAVSMSEIGTAAGIVGSGVYRHFDSKAVVLVAVFDRVIDSLLREASETVAAADGERQALEGLIREQVTFVVGKRELAAVYHREVHSLPPEDRRRLRRKQRFYLEEWVHVVAELRPELAESEVRLVVHGAIGAIQSALNYDTSGLPADRLADFLAGMAGAALGLRGRAG